MSKSHPEQSCWISLYSDAVTGASTPEEAFQVTNRYKDTLARLLQRLNQQAQADRDPRAVLGVVATLALCLLIESELQSGASLPEVVATLAPIALMAASSGEDCCGKKKTEVVTDLDRISAEFYEEKKAQRVAQAIEEERGMGPARSMSDLNRIVGQFENQSSEQMRALESWWIGN